MAHQAIFQINNKTYHFNVEDDLAQMAQTVDTAEFERLFLTAFRDYFVQKSQKPLAYHRLGGVQPFDVPDDFNEIEIDDFDEYLKGWLVNYLLDTHILLWAIQNHPKLSQKAKDIIVNPDNELLFLMTVDNKIAQYNSQVLMV